VLSTIFLTLFSVAPVRHGCRVSQQGTQRIAGRTQGPWAQSFFRIRHSGS
jgi:hypothetical protein